MSKPKNYVWEVAEGNNPNKILFRQVNNPRNNLRSSGFFFIDWDIGFYDASNNNFVKGMSLKEEAAINPFKEFFFGRAGSKKNLYPMGKQEYDQFGKGWASLSGKREWRFEFKLKRDIINKLKNEKKALIFRIIIRTYGINFSKSYAFNSRIDYNKFMLLAVRYCTYNMTGKGVSFNDMINKVFKKDWDWIIKKITEEELAEELFGTNAKNRKKISKIIEDAPESKERKKISNLSFEHLKSQDKGYGDELIANVLLRPRGLDVNLNSFSGEQVIALSSIKELLNDKKTKKSKEIKEKPEEVSEEKVKESIEVLENFFDPNAEAWLAKEYEKNFKDLLAYLERNLETLKTIVPEEGLIKLLLLAFIGKDKKRIEDLELNNEGITFNEAFKKRESDRAVKLIRSLDSERAGDYLNERIKDFRRKIRPYYLLEEIKKYIIEHGSARE